MSDRSEHSSASQSSDDDSNDRSRANDDEADRDSLDYESEDASGSEVSGDDQKEEIDFSKLKLCPKHNPGEMRESCSNARQLLP